MRLPQKEAKSKIEQDLVAREARGLKFAEQNEAAELESMNKELTKREEVNTTIRQGMQALIHQKGVDSKTTNKLNFSDFVAVMSGSETSIQRQLNQQVTPSPRTQPTHHSSF